MLGRGVAGRLRTRLAKHHNTPCHHRDGDRFWFENDPYFLANAPLLDEVRSTILADIIRRNTPIEDEIQDNLFLVESRA
ncbi:MAG: hypothetical protein OXC00_10485 [Acidimicrobiaceae bacterium]|nr:hypothetical protein [Acidimicrobiaceae bacterium]